MQTAVERYGGAPATWTTMFVCGLSATGLFVFSSAAACGRSVVAAVPEE
jgi:hypothetical protein